MNLSLNQVIEYVKVQKQCMKPESIDDQFKLGAYSSYEWVLGLLDKVNCNDVENDRY